MASPRLRQVIAEFPEVRVVHRCFALAPTPDAIVVMFGSKKRGKAEILEHWRLANRYDDVPRFRPDLMAARPFDYPYSMPGLRACKAAESIGGQQAHWDLFDRIQYAHLIECRNIADDAVLRDCAVAVGLDVERWEVAYRSPETQAAVDADLARARMLSIAAVPTLVADGTEVITGARPAAHYRAWLRAVLEQRARAGRDER
ncbi:hypothetical protein HRbin27_00506 [bacterium HR27]|nr:hypothetical protein HRbin27_00506 [bacterium HR27]